MHRGMPGNARLGSASAVLDKFQLCIECLGFGFALSNKFRRPVSPCRYSAFSRTTKSQCLFKGMIIRVGPPRGIIRWLTARI